MDGVAAAKHHRLPVQGFSNAPEEIERQWYEQVYRGRGDSMRQLTWRAVIMGSALGGVLSLTNLYAGLKAGRAGWAVSLRALRAAGKAAVEMFDEVSFAPTGNNLGQRARV